MAAFEENCPYFRPSSPEWSVGKNPLMFRLEEQFSDFSVYTGDSYGDRSFIDTSMARACSMQCRCRSLRPDSFAFVVRKTAFGINVKLCASILKLFFPLLLVPKISTKPPNVVGGFDLLKNINYLESQLRELRTAPQGSTLPQFTCSNVIPSRKEITQLEAEMSLLVEGLVADYQVFESFGHEKLYEKGFLTYDRWKSFQSSKTSRSLEQLDWATHTIDQFEGDEDSNEMGRDDLAELLQASRSMPSVPSLGITCPQHEFGGSLNDRDSPLIAAIYMGRNDVIAELLNHGANPMILSHIKQEDQWLVAQSLLDHGVSAKRLLESTHRFEHVEPRLLHVLMEKGADIYPSWPTWIQGFLTYALHVPDHTIQEAKSTRARNFQLLGAIQTGDLTCAEELISYGADPTFGIDAALVGRKWDILRLLLQKGADPRVLEFGKPMVYLQEDMMADGCLLTVAEEGLTTVVNALLHLRGCNKMVAEGLRRPSLTKLIQYDRTPILGMLLCKGLFSREYLANSSGWSLPIAAETSMPLFGLLLSFGACASTALIAAVTERNLTSVILLLKGIKEHSMPNNVNALRIHGCMTLLMKAVHDGSAEIAQHLIDNGADPYIDTWWGNSFTIAEEKGFKGLSQMLDRVRYTPQSVTSTMLKYWGSFTEREDHVWDYHMWLQRFCYTIPRWPRFRSWSWNWGEATAINLRQSNIPTAREDCLYTIKIRCLKREFRRQHTHILKCARASTNLPWYPPREGLRPAWGDVFDYNHSKAWSRGIAVMRGLCRGEASSNLYDTIMFLVIGKSICHSKIASSIPDHHAEFLADLGRWQVLFRSDEWSLSAFRNAVSDIWQVSVEELDRVHPPDSTSLIHFQELAMSLISNVEQSLDRQRDLGKGLLASQERWGWNRVPEISETQRPEPFDMQFPESIVERGKFTESDKTDSTASGETDVFQSPETQVPLRDAIHNDSKLRTCNTVVVLLMAGFVFGVVLVFLKELQHRALLLTLSSSTAPVIYPFVIAREMLQGAVHHLCVTIKNEFALNVLERVESALNNAIQQGYIASFSDLAGFIHEANFAQTCGEPLVAIKIRHSLLAACSIWQPSYDLQQRYHILETYLGLKEHESIVPHAIHPTTTTPAEEPRNVRDSFSRLNSQALSTTFSSLNPQSLESNSSPATAAYTNDIEMEMQIDGTPPPHQQPPVPHTGDPSDQPQAKTYCKECNHDFKIVSNYNKHRKDKHERVRFACRHPPCRMKYSRKNYRDIHEKERHEIGPA